MKARNLLLILWIFLISMQLQGCMDAAVSSAQAIYNHKTLNSNLRNHYISMKANQAIYWNSKRFANTHVEVNQFNNVILVTGQIPTIKQRNEIVKIIKNVVDSNEIYNATELSQPTSTLVRLSDTWLSLKVRAKIVASNNIDPEQINVVTENGTVFLMGTVFPDQADEAVDLARNTDGVKQVVKVFSYLQLTKKPIRT